MYRPSPSEPVPESDPGATALQDTWEDVEAARRDGRASGADGP
jgi:hypothetical protein